MPMPNALAPWPSAVLCEFGADLCVCAQVFGTKIDESGVGRSFVRELRRMFPGLFHSDRQILKWSKEERQAATELLGKPIKIKNGWMLDMEKICVAIFFFNNRLPVLISRLNGLSSSN
jgi:hypothetical protein